MRRSKPLQYSTRFARHKYFTPQRRFGHGAVIDCSCGHVILFGLNGGVLASAHAPEELQALAVLRALTGKWAEGLCNCGYFAANPAIVRAIISAGVPK